MNKATSQWGHDYLVTMCIYRIDCKVTGKIYIGQSIGKVGRRWTAHCSMKSGAGKSALKLAIQKYGKNNFHFYTIDRAETLEDLNKKEIFWIEKLCSLAPSGYNLTKGGNRNHVFSDEAKLRMKQSAKLRFEREGRTVIPRTPEQVLQSKNICAQKSRERLLGNTYRRGRKCSEETKEKIRLSKIGNINRNTKVVRSDGILFDSITLAALAIGAKNRSVSAVLSKIRKSVYGYSFSYFKGGELSQHLR